MDERRGPAAEIELELVVATAELLSVAIERPEDLGHELAAEVVVGWEAFPEALLPLRDAAESDPSNPWGSRFFVLVEPRRLVGFGGFYGPPTDEGVVEIGYAVAPPWQGRGVATRAVELMIDFAIASGASAIEAHTLGEENASTRVLVKLGFGRIGTQTDPSEGVVWHWRRDL